MQAARPLADHSTRRRRGTRRDAAELTRLVQAVTNGDNRAWNALVDEFAGLVWAVARAHRTTSRRIRSRRATLHVPVRSGALTARAARHLRLSVVSDLVTRLFLCLLATQIVMAIVAPIARARCII